MGHHHRYEAPLSGHWKHGNLAIGRWWNRLYGRCLFISDEKPEIYSRNLAHFRHDWDGFNVLLSLFFRSLNSLISFEGMGIDILIIHNAFFFFGQFEFAIVNFNHFHVTSKFMIDLSQIQSVHFVCK